MNKTGTLTEMFKDLSGQVRKLYKNDDKIDTIYYNIMAMPVLEMEKEQLVKCIKPCSEEALQLPLSQNNALYEYDPIKIARYCAKKPQYERLLGVYRNCEIFLLYKGHAACINNYHAKSIKGTLPLKRYSLSGEVSECKIDFIIVRRPIDAVFSEIDRQILVHDYNEDAVAIEKTCDKVLNKLLSKRDIFYPEYDFPVYMNNPNTGAGGACRV